jgi:hypothetical protein
VFKQWLAPRPKPWQKRIEVVATDAVTGFKTATAEELPDAVPVMDPFHVIRLAGDALENCRRRVQHNIFGRQGITGDPLYQARRTLLIGAGLLTDKQQTRLEALFADDQPSNNAPMTSSATSTGPAPATDQSRRSTADSNTSAASPSAFGI